MLGEWVEVVVVSGPGQSVLVGDELSAAGGGQVGGRLQLPLTGLVGVHARPRSVRHGAVATSETGAGATAGSAGAGVTVRVIVTVRQTSARQDWA